MPSKTSEEEASFTIVMSKEKETSTSTGEVELGGSPPGMIDACAERRLLRKIDLHVFPILFIIYVMSFLDRINISNARIQGMTEDLDLHGDRFNIALFVSLSRFLELILSPYLHFVGLLRPVYPARSAKQHGLQEVQACLLPLVPDAELGHR